MGQGKQRSEAKVHRQSISEAPFVELENPTLFSGATAERSVAVKCHLNPGAVWPTVGAKIQFVDFKHEAIEVVLGVNIIGYVDDQGSHFLREEKLITSRPGSRIEGSVTDVEIDWGIFTAQLK